LLAEGRVRRDGQRLTADTFVVPVGAEQGWEAAVFDHFSTVANAIAAKVRRGAGSEAGDTVGGATLTFEIAPGHPLEAEVYGLLARVRKDVNDLWARVAQENQRRAIDEARRVKVSFYFGQNVEETDGPIEEAT
jgi:hypothetical protein